MGTGGAPNDGGGSEIGGGGGSSVADASAGDVFEEPIFDAGMDGRVEGVADARDAARAVGGFRVEPNQYLVTTEAGGQATFTMVLTSMPLANVTVPLTSSDTTEGTVSPSSLIFTTANWNEPQTVTLTGVDDLLCDGNQRYTIVTGNAVSADPAYDGLDPSDVSVSNTDNEGGGFTVNPGRLTTTEKGGSATFIVFLNCQPFDDVTIPCTSTNTAEGTVDPGVIVFTREHWKTPATVTVTGVDDTVKDGDQVYRIRVGPGVSLDPAFDGVENSVSVTNVDDD
jgi:hypothetical protein